jgi:hypothetical protein
MLDVPPFEDQGMSLENLLLVLMTMTTNIVLNSVPHALRIRHVAPVPKL